MFQSAFIAIELQWTAIIESLKYTTLICNVADFKIR